MLLGDLGADVIKVEAPEGDLGRQLGPPWVNDTSAVFVAFNRNKRSIVLDLKTEKGLEIALQLVASADVLVESFRPGVLGRLGLGYDACRALRPDIVYCSISAYGSTGPGARRGGVDGILQAASGLMTLLGEEGQAPCKVQTPIVDITTGHLAAFAVVAQLLQRERTGKGGFIDASMLAAAVSLQQASITGFLSDGQQPARIGSAAPYSAPNEAFPAEDGWIMIAAYQDQRWERLCLMLDREDLLSDPRFASSGNRVLNREAMRTELGATFLKRNCSYWLRELDIADIPCAKVATYNDLIDEELFTELDMIVAANNAHGQTLRFPGLPLNCAENRAMPHRPPPAQGEHSEAILKELGYGAVEASAIAAAHCRPK